MKYKVFFLEEHTNEHIAGLVSIGRWCREVIGNYEKDWNWDFDRDPSGLRILCFCFSQEKYETLFRLRFSSYLTLYNSTQELVIECGNRALSTVEKNYVNRMFED